MCESAMNLNQEASRELQASFFTEHLLVPLVSLSTDRVVNVRMQLAETLAAHYRKFEGRSLIEESETLKRAVSELKRDSSRDVKQAMNSIPDRVLFHNEFQKEQKLISESIEEVKEDREVIE